MPLSQIYSLTGILCAVLAVNFIVYQRYPTSSLKAPVLGVSALALVSVLAVLLYRLLVVHR